VCLQIKHILQTAQYLRRINSQFMYFTYYHGINSLPIPQILVAWLCLNIIHNYSSKFWALFKVNTQRCPINRGPKIGHLKFYHCRLVVLHTHSNLQGNLFKSICGIVSHDCGQLDHNTLKSQIVTQMSEITLAPAPCQLQG
jgi:hypothetical protein